MKKLFSALLAIFVFALSSVAHAAPFLQVENGVLTGAKGVLVAGHLYNVDFKDGTCAQYFNGCMNIDSFIFDTPASANEASQVLLDTVFVDSDAGNFDHSTELTVGCEVSGWCVAYTPFAVVGVPYFSLGVSGAGNSFNQWVSNWGREYPDYVIESYVVTRVNYAGGGYNFFADVDLSVDGSALTSGGVGYVSGVTVDRFTGVWAVWSHASTVPEPESLTLFSLALAGLVLTRRKSKQD